MRPVFFLFCRLGIQLFSVDFYIDKLPPLATFSEPWVESDVTSFSASGKSVAASAIRVERM